jgi:UDP-2,4-diacetamido-2,4,6-trideoxy-beta-L-altropyranose hydrolase
VSLPAKPRILFFADAGPEVGGGHVMRCLTLARALAERGAECAFVESRAAAPILRRFGWPAQTLLAITDAQDLAGLVDYACDFADRFEADAVVIDHYQAGAPEETQLQAGSRRIMAIDDLADRRHACDLLLDPGYGRRREHYAGLIRPTCVARLGPSYALVRPEFAAARQRALSRRAKHGPAARVLVALGMTDIGGITERVVRALAPALDEARADVVIGSEAASLPALRALAASDRRIRLWVDDVDMATLTADADLAIGAGGSSVWERAVVGLPSATVILAENQRVMIEHMADAGFTRGLDAAAPDFEARLVEVWRRLEGDTALRWRLTERCAELCDGHGAERVAEAVLKL